MTKIKLPFGLERNNGEPVVETTEIDHNGQPLDEVLDNTVQVIDLSKYTADGKFISASEFVVRVDEYSTIEHRAYGALRFDLLEVGGNISAYVLLQKDDSVENGWKWLGAISTEASGKLLNRHFEEVEKIDNTGYAEFKFYLDHVFPPATVDAYTKDESDAKFQPKGSYATSEDIANLESELGEFVKVVDLGKLPENGKFFCDAPFILCGTESKIDGDLSGDNYVIPHTRDLGGYRVDCFLHDVTSSSAGYKYYITLSPMLTHTPNEYQIIGYLEILTLDNVKSRLFNFAGNPVEKLDGMDATQWTNNVLPMFNEGVYERMGSAEEKLTQIGLQVSELETTVEEGVTASATSASQASASASASQASAQTATSKLAIIQSQIAEMTTPEGEAIPANVVANVASNKAEIDAVNGNILFKEFSCNVRDWKVVASGISVKKGETYSLEIILPEVADSTKYFYLSDAVNDSGKKYITANISTGNSQRKASFVAQDDVDNLNIISLGTYGKTKFIVSTKSLSTKIDENTEEIKNVKDETSSLYKEIKGVLLSKEFSCNVRDWKVVASGISVKKGETYSLEVILPEVADTTKYFYLSDAINDSGKKYITATISAGNAQRKASFVAENDIDNLNIISYGIYGSSTFIFETKTLSKKIDDNTEAVKNTQEEMSSISKMVKFEENLGNSLFTINGMLNPQGQSATDTAWMRSDYTEVSEGDIIKVHVTTDHYRGVLAVSTGKSEGTITYYITGVDNKTDYEYTIKSGERYIRVCTKLSAINDSSVEISHPYSKADYVLKRTQSIIGRNAHKDTAIRSSGIVAVTGETKPLSFIHLSDIHTQAGDYMCVSNMVEVLNAYDNIQFAIATGDLVYDTFADSMDWYDKGIVNAKKPVFNVIGNHDAGQYNASKGGLATVGTDAQVYAKYIEPYISKWGLKSDGGGIAHPDGKSYYFTDFTTEKVRMIVLCEFESDCEISDTDSTKYKYSREYRSMRQEQVTWLINSLSTTPSGYGVVIALHQPDRLKDEDNAFVSDSLIDKETAMVYSGDKEWLLKILDAFQRKTSLQLTFSQVGGVVTDIDASCDFTDVSAELICTICGHTHNDYVGHYKNYPNIVTLVVGSDNLKYTGKYCQRKVGTLSEDLFNIVNIDQNRRKISIVRVGADASITGQDRRMMTINY